MIPPAIKRLMPSLDIAGGTPESTATCSLDDLRRLLALALAEVNVDEVWYLAQYPDVREGVESGRSGSATDHFLNSGYLEGRLPEDPAVDEEWYKAANADVAAAIRQGKYRNAKAHYIESGYAEGRQPQPSARAYLARLAAARSAAR